MSWFIKGVQSAIFHYVSCAPCTGYMYKKQRRKQAKEARKARTKLQMEQPELYHHPEPTGTNPFWNEEIAMGPGPPPRRARRTNTGSTRAAVHVGNSTAVSQVGSSIDGTRGDDDARLSDETLDDENWNRKRYQREDEDLWGFSDIPSLPPTGSGSSVGVAGITRPGTSRSGSYYTARVPPVNDLHPPVVSIPSPDPADNRWMLQPPPKASVMNGKERATNRSRSGSGASSRVELGLRSELSLQRQVSSRHLLHKLERGETPELPPLSRGNSYTNILTTHRHDRPRTPQTRPPSAASSRTKRRRDTAMTRSDTLDHSSGDSHDTPTKRRSDSPQKSQTPGGGISFVRVRTSRQHLSTVLSSGSGASLPADRTDPPETGTENTLPAFPPKTARRPRYSSQSSDSIPYLTKHRSPLTSSDVASLAALQDLVSPSALLNSRFVSAPLLEARIKLPPSDGDEERMLGVVDAPWQGSGFAVSRPWGPELVDGEARVPFDREVAEGERDPKMRWSVDF